jgi:hypothetical protein
MPETCFSYSSGMPLGRPNRDAAPPATRDLLRTPVMGPCFSYSASVPLHGLRRIPSGPCFSYPAAAPLGRLRRTPGGNPSPVSATEYRSSPETPA